MPEVKFRLGMVKETVEIWSPVVGLKRLDGIFTGKSKKVILIGDGYVKEEK